eukprot:scaffold5681_cov377-Prasinococcus_capsulatus_cf.AAC.19
MAVAMNLAVVLVVASAAITQAFYLPGVAPQDYAKDDLISLKVNKLTSIKTQLPYEYYSLPYCRPDPIINSAENLGEVLRGDRIENSLYQVRIARPVKEAPAGALSIAGVLGDAPGRAVQGSVQAGQPDREAEHGLPKQDRRRVPRQHDPGQPARGHGQDA